MSIKRRNRLLPDGWEIHVNDDFVSELEKQAIKFADHLDKRAAELRDRGKDDANGAVVVRLIVAPDKHVIARALQLMHGRGYSVTIGTRLPGASSLDLNVRRRVNGPSDTQR